MGNPAILGKIEDVDDGVVVLPRPPRMLWAVYQLRDYDGTKLTTRQIVRSLQVGVLSINRATTETDEMVARLVHPSGYPPLANLWNARLSRLDAERGLLLYGTILNSRHGTVLDVPQAWWCVPQVRPSSPDLQHDGNAPT
jgi:hypothetical protein